MEIQFQPHLRVPTRMASATGLRGAPSSGTKLGGGARCRKSPMEPAATHQKDHIFRGKGRNPVASPSLRRRKISSKWRTRCS